MGKYKPVEIISAAFLFCKYSIAAGLWLSILLQNLYIFAGVEIILVLSVLLKVAKAPLVFFYMKTVERIIPSKKIFVNEYAVRFAHIIGAAMGAVGIILIIFVNPLVGWIFTGVLALLKTSGAMGYCGAMKLYDCLFNSSGQCCRFGKKIKSCVNEGKNTD